ncbi:MAG: hypothetical protein KBE65_21655 [Phycisphaerae bacterium]|nr:hypothetical protein [Phycisphaerae bacterium]
MRQINKTIVMIGALAIIVSCRKEQPPAEQQAAEQRIGRELRALASRHSADYEWKAAGDTLIFSVQVEDFLLSRIGRPLLTIASVTDVQRREGQYSLIARDSFSVDDLLLRLDCSRSQAEFVMNIPEERGWWGLFAIVFRPESVRQPTWELTAQPEDANKAHVAVGPPRTWFLRGECLDLSYVGEDEIDLVDLKVMLSKKGSD